MRNILRIGLALACLVYLGFAVAYFVVGYRLVSVILLISATIIIWLIWRYVKWRQYKQRFEEKRQKRAIRREEELQKRERLKSEINNYINDALGMMDSISNWYNSEEEANKELILSLKTKGLDATYQFRLPDGTTADGRVGDILIEGKLEPDKSGIDRLIGQLETYSRYPYRLNVIIYGRIQADQLKRIGEHIDKHYPDKVFLSYLDKPHRFGRIFDK